MKLIDEARMWTMIRIAIKNAGSQKAFAAQVGMSEQYLVDMLKRRRPISDKVLAWFGLERIMYYQVKK